MYNYPGIPTPAAPPASPQPPRRPRRLKLLAAIAAGVCVALIAAGVTLAIQGSGPAPVTAHGTLEVAASTLDGTSTSDYQDIADGGQVTVINSAAQVIGTGTLAFQKTTGVLLLNADWYKFTVTVPGGLPRYGIEIGQNRGTVWFTVAQMKTGPSMCLGDGC